MKRRRHPLEQIIRKLREAERMLGEGKQIPDAAKELGISEPCRLRLVLEQLRCGHRADLVASVVLRTSAAVPVAMEIGQGIDAAARKRPRAHPFESPCQYPRVVRSSRQARGEPAGPFVALRAPMGRPVREAAAAVLHGRRGGAHWRRHEPGRGDDEEEGEALDGQRQGVAGERVARRR